MASIETKQETGFTLVERSISNLTDMIMEMKKSGRITEEDTVMMLNKFKEIADICRDYKEPEINNTSTYSF